MMEELLLKEIISDIFHVDVENKIIDHIVMENKQGIHMGERLDDENHVIGLYEGKVVSIEKKTLDNLFDAITKLI